MWIFVARRRNHAAVTEELKQFELLPKLGNNLVVEMSQNVAINSLCLGTELSVDVTCLSIDSPPANCFLHYHNRVKICLWRLGVCAMFKYKLTS